MEINKANSEYLATDKKLKPLLVKDTNNEYHVFIHFSKEFLISKGFEIVK